MNILRNILIIKNNLQYKKKKRNILKNIQILIFRKILLVKIVCYKKKIRLMIN